MKIEKGSVTLLSTIEQTQNFLVSAQDIGSRVDAYLSVYLPYSRSFCKQIIAEKLVSINDIIATQASRKLKLHDAITVRQPALGKKLQKTVTQVGLEKHPVKIVFSNDNFMVVDKPAGMIVHNTLNDMTSVSLVDWLKHTCADAMKQFESFERPGIVHRLDKQTSGIMIAVKTKAAQNYFLHMFKGRLIRKTYLALVKGHPPASGTIDLPVGRNPVHRFKMAAFSHKQVLDEQLQVQTKSAITHYNVLEYFDDTALVQVNPVTGRTHQIRVHFAAIGHGLVGDVIYYKKSKIIKRHALHAHSLAFELHDQAYSFLVPPPDDFQAACAFFQAGNSCR